MAQCELNINDLWGGAGSGINDPDFLNPDYEPVECSTSPFLINIWYNGVEYDFAPYYLGDMRLSLTIGQKGTGSFSIDDPYIEGSVLPFIPEGDMYIEIWNAAKTDIYMAGYTTSCVPEMKRNGIRDDFTESRVYRVNFVDLYQALERNIVTEFYSGKKLGFILKDIITRYTILDGSEIDANLGYEIDEYPVIIKKPAQVLSSILSYLNMTYVIDYATKKVFLLEKNSGSAAFNLEITEENKYDIFDRDTFQLYRDSSSVRTSVLFYYNEKYSQGTVNTEQDNNIIVGFGAPPLTEWDDIPSGSKIRIEGNDAEYTIEKNLSSGPVQSLRLSSDYKEANETNANYYIIGKRTLIQVTDPTAKNRLASMRGDNGDSVYVVTDDQNAYTAQEARQIAQAELALSQPLPKGGAKTYTDTFQELPLLPGKTFNVNLPASRKYVGSVVAEGIELIDRGGTIFAEDHPSGENQPNFEIVFKWSAALSSSVAQLRKIMYDLRKIKLSAEDASGGLQKVEDIIEYIGFKDCVHIAESPDSEINQDVIMLDEVYSSEIIELGAYYTDLDFTASYGVSLISFTAGDMPPTEPEADEDGLLFLTQATINDPGGAIGLNELIIPNMDDYGDGDYLVRLYARLVTPNAAARDVDMRVNGDTAITHYKPSDLVYDSPALAPLFAEIDVTVLENKITITTRSSNWATSVASDNHGYIQYDNSVAITSFGFEFQDDIEEGFIKIYRDETA